MRFDTESGILSQGSGFFEGASGGLGVLLERGMGFRLGFRLGYPCEEGLDFGLWWAEGYQLTLS